MDELTGKKCKLKNKLANWNILIKRKKVKIIKNRINI